ncbi:MAG TPA: DUF4142 domain-containing protein [Pyrinomonadaceae bacterium]|nr:DUF4142 domain-containing protein [Pyrinomonadaceae bacterium]
MRSRKLLGASLLTAALALSLLPAATTAALASARQSALAPADQKFLTTAAADGALEVELGRLASQRAASDDVRRFGSRMLEDHSKAGDELRQLAGSKNLQLPAALGPKERAQVSRLGTLAGPSFDREYVKLMLKEHKRAVSMFQKQSAQGRDPEVRAFAARMLPALQTHLSMIQDISNGMN